jgi:lysophospholipase L1-like esterase
MKKIVCLFFGFSTILCAAQNAAQFEEEIQSIQQKYDSVWDETEETIVFTGSSSIRLWEDLQALFPDYQIVNTGFGGSRVSDLLVFSDKLILKYNPKMVFIYEGDNDIFDRKRPREVIDTTKKIISKIQHNNPQTRIVLISAKPSLVRWHLKRKYKALNRKLKKLTKQDPTLEYANIWDVMLTGRQLNESLFIEDGLHINDKGYELWYGVIKNYLN